MSTAIIPLTDSVTQVEVNGRVFFLFYKEGKIETFGDGDEPLDQHADALDDVIQDILRQKTKNDVESNTWMDNHYYVLDHKTNTVIERIVTSPHSEIWHLHCDDFEYCFPYVAGNDPMDERIFLDNCRQLRPGGMLESKEDQIREAFQAFKRTYGDIQQIGG